MAISITSIGSASSSSGASVAVSVPAGGVPANALVVVLVSDRSTSATSSAVTDSASNVYTGGTSVSQAGSSTNGFGRVFYDASASALSSGNTITYTKGVSGAVAVAAALYATGADATSPLDTAVTASATGTSTSPSVTSGTPSVSGELFVAMVATVGTTPLSTNDSTNGWTSTASGVRQSGSTSTSANLIWGSQVNTGTGTKVYAPTMGESRAWADIIVGFKPDTSTTLSFSVTEGSDTASANITSSTNTALAATEAADTANVAIAVSTSSVNIALSVTEIADAAAMTATSSTDASLAVTETADTASVAITAVTNASLAATEAQDTAATTIAVVTNTSFAATEASDTASATITSVTNASLAATEASDTASATVTSVTNTSLAATEAADTASFDVSIAAATANISLAATEGADTASASITAVTSASLTATETADTAAAQITSVTQTALSATEAKDTASFALSDALSASLAATEAPDTFAGQVFELGAPVTYYLSSTNSDLTGGADFSKALATTASTGTITFSVAGNATETSYAWTGAGLPGASGVTGDYTVAVNVTTGGTSTSLVVSLSRVNSSGTVQTTSSASASQSTATTGTKTFTFTGVNLGTWATGDRLRVNYAFTKTGGGSASISIGTNSSSTVAVPWLDPELALVGVEAQDTASFNVVYGPYAQIALAATEPADTASVSVSSVTNASLAATEAKDIASIVVGTPTLYCDLAATEAQDVASFAAKLSDTVQLVATEAKDTASFAVDAKTNAALASTEAKDTANFAVEAQTNAALSVTEAQDTASFAVSVAVNDNELQLAATEAPDRANVIILYGGADTHDGDLGGPIRRVKDRWKWSNRQDEVREALAAASSDEQAVEIAYEAVEAVVLQQPDATERLAELARRESELYDQTLEIMRRVLEIRVAQHRALVRQFEAAARLAAEEDDLEVLLLAA